MTKLTLNSLEDDPHACSDRMDAAMQSIYNQFQAEVVIGALSTSFAQLIVERGGSDEPLVEALHVFSTSPPPLRSQFRECHAQVKTMIYGIEQEGFSLDAVLWAVLGSILALYEASRFPQDRIDRARDNMIVLMNEARQLSVN